MMLSVKMVTCHGCCTAGLTARPWRSGFTSPPSLTRVIVSIDVWVLASRVSSRRSVGQGCRTRTQPWRLELTLDNNKTHISQSRPWTSTCGPCVFERKANKQSQRAESVPAVRSVCARVQGCRYPRGVSQRCHVVYRQVLFGILLCIKLASDAQVLRTSVRPNSMDGHAVHEEPPPVDVCSS